MPAAVPSYEEALAEFQVVYGEAADEHWRSLLYLLTNVSSLWRLRPCVDFSRAEIDIGRWKEATAGMSHGEQLLAQAALHLFNDEHPAPALSALVTVLDDTAWRIFCLALHVRRYGSLPGR